MSLELVAVRSCPHLSIDTEDRHGEASAAFEPLERRLCMAAPSLQTTFSLPTGTWTPTVYRASPLFVDIFNTGKDELIAVASGAQLVAYSENADGSATAVVTYQVPGGVADIKSTPIVVTNPTTGRKDLFAAMGRDETNPGTLEDGRVFGWDLQTGQLLPAWASGQSTGHNPTGYSGVYGSLTSGNLEGNGLPDIVATSFSHEVTAFRLDGSILWQWDNDDTIVSGAVVADIDRDGVPEVIVGGDSSASPFFQQGGWVNVLSNTGILKWRKQILGEVTWSSPIVADLQNTGYLDIVIGTGDNFSLIDGVSSTQAGDYIYAFDPFGNTLPGWPYHTTTTGNTVGHEVLASPAVDDLLGNGQLDIVALDRDNYLHVIQPNGQDLPGFVGGKNLTPDVAQGVLPDNYGSPVIADVTGSGKPDIIAGAGPFLRAFDTSGNLITIGTTTTGTGGLPEGIDSAPAIGNFDGSGGLTLAIVTYDPNLQDRPDRVQIYQLPQSTLTPPWPFLRRTITGDAVGRSGAYDQQYVTSVYKTFNTLFNGQAATDPVYVNALNLDVTNLLNTAQLIALSTPVLQAEVGKAYQSLLGRAPDPGGLNFWTTYLTVNSYRAMEINIASTAEFAQRAGNNIAQEVAQLYQAILGRTPSDAEINNWVASKLPVGTIATIFVNSSEAIADQFSALAQAQFGAGAQNSIPGVDEVTYSLDIHGGSTEGQIISENLASAGNLVATNFVGGYVADLYRDILSRNPAVSEVASWLNAVDQGSVAFAGIAPLILNSSEARADYVQNEFYTLLGHGANPSTIGVFSNYTNRESLAILLVGTPEYYAKNGGTNASFVVAAFRDLAGIGISQAVVNAFVAQMAAGLSTAGVAQDIIYQGPLYFQNLVVNQLIYDIPWEAQGVLRTGELPQNAAGQPINPQPSLINYFLGMYESGLSDEQVLSNILNTPQYYNRVSFFKGLKRTPGVRY